MNLPGIGNEFASIRSELQMLTGAFTASTNMTGNFYRWISENRISVASRSGPKRINVRHIPPAFLRTRKSDFA